MNNNIYIPQIPLLQNIIPFIWQWNGITEFKNETIIPKGIIEIIFDFGEHDSLQGKLNGKSFQLAKCFINGFNTSPINLQLPERHTFLGVQFHASAVKGIFRFAASEFTNLVVDLSLLNVFFSSLWHQLAEKNSFAERVSVILAWIKCKMSPISQQEQFLSQFLRNSAHEAKTVTQLSGFTCCCTRQLSRKIYELTGMNTEEVLLYKKYLHSLDLVHHTGFSLTQIAYMSNFADQSHFIKSFKAFAQMTPGEYRLSKSHLKGHIFENVR